MPQIAGGGPLFHFTVDVDWIPGSGPGLTMLWEICDAFSITPTLFITGRFAEMYPENVREAVARGAHIGTHGWAHGIDQDEDFSLLTEGQQVALLRKATLAIDRAAGVRPTSFRAPNLRVNHRTFRALAREGYVLDSSIPARRFDLFCGSVNTPVHLLSPLSPHAVATGIGTGRPVIEIPPSALIVPCNFRSLRTFGARSLLTMTAVLRRFLPAITFYIHPAELVEASKLTFDPRYAGWYRSVGPQHRGVLEEYLEGVRRLGLEPASYDVYNAETHAPGKRAVV